MAVYDIVKQTNKNWSSNSSKTLWKIQRSAVNLCPDRAGKSWIGSSESESGAAACPSEVPHQPPSAHFLPCLVSRVSLGALATSLPHSLHNNYKKVRSQDVQIVYGLLTLLLNGAGKEHTRTELDSSTLIFLQLWCLSDWIHFGKCPTSQIDVFVSSWGFFSSPVLWKDLTLISCI